MSRLRNPFRLRASEKIESDASFLRLYSPIVLESLAEKDKDGKLWDNVMYIHSSPGAGKTSLLRVFEPGTLNTLINNKSATDYKSLYTTLKKLNVLSDRGIEVLGVTLVCTRNYEILEELDVSSAQKIRYFFSLLNARIFLATLRSIVSFSSSNASFNEALESISYTYDNRENYFSDLKVPCTGKDLYQWASNIEKKVYQAIDSFLPLSDIQPQGHDELFSLTVLKPEYLLVNGQPIVSKILFMLDDAHKLSFTQRISLKKYVIEKRGAFSIWISQRLEALEPKDNLRSFEGRDYEELNLEKFWAERPAKFEKVLFNIADKRAAISSEDVNSFMEYLDSDLEEELLQPEFLKTIEATRQNIGKIADFTSKFDKWINYVETLESTPLEKALLFKKLEILINRNLGKSQLTLEFPLTEQELFDKFKSDIDATSKLFMSYSTKIPYYYGFSDLVKVSSNNIEQFLSFSGDMFEEMLSNRISGLQINVDTTRQQRILTEVAGNKWKELSKILPYSTQVTAFLSKLGEACVKDTYKPNAPYAPGVTGFAIKVVPSMFDTNLPWEENELYAPMINVISTCVAFNLLEIKEVNQGEKGQKWQVYYLNRWLCVKFNLPFSYGGWRHKNTDELLKWTKI
ncbi:MAG: hypothetical protein B7Y24_08125 [Sphingobacteriales bacterium 16-39-50]|nr:MAG: hypothetical protein B7Y24_08125 [Sphingobacteriales bacterium 16-39-50]